MLRHRHRQVRRAIGAAMSTLTLAQLLPSMSTLTLVKAQASLATLSKLMSTGELLVAEGGARSGNKT